jgi:pyruvate,water dikinase
VYLNLTEFMTVASQIPFLSPQTLLSLGGGGELNILQDCYEKLSTLGFILNLPLTLPKIALSQLYTPIQARDWVQRFRTMRDRFFLEDLSILTRRELKEKFDWMEDIFNRTGEIMLSCASNALSSYVGVATVLKQLFGNESGKELQHLFGGLTELLSAEPGYAILRLAQIVRRHKALEEVFHRHEPQDILRILKNVENSAEFLVALNEFLRKFGHRAPREAEISTPRWREDPTFIISIVQRHLSGPHIPDPDRLESRRISLRTQAEKRVLDRLPRPFQWTFRKILSYAHRAYRLREALRGAVVDTLSMYRRMVLESGNRLVEAKLAADREDAFFLKKDEIFRFLMGNCHEDIPLRIAARRAAYEVFVRAPDPPDTFVLHNGDMIPSRTTEVMLTSPVLSGLGGSSGVVTGTARVIRDPKDGKDLKHGEIMVAPYTDVGWTPLFLIASGVVMDIGGPLSHSTIVAREYGIPAVVNVKHGTTVIRTGDKVTIDGDRGLVYLHENQRMDASETQSDRK